MIDQGTITLTHRENTPPPTSRRRRIEHLCVRTAHTHTKNPRTNSTQLPCVSYVSHVVWLRVRVWRVRTKAMRVFCPPFTPHTTRLFDVSAFFCCVWAMCKQLFGEVRITSHTTHKPQHNDSRWRKNMRVGWCSRPYSRLPLCTTKCDNDKYTVCSASMRLVGFC